MKETIDTVKAVEALGRATSQVLADMAFIDAACASFDGPVAYDVCAAIDILKPLSCRLELRMPRSLSDSIVETLGADGPAADDAVLEMVNILAGVFISEYFGSGAVIKLELPTFLYESTEGDEDVPIAMVRGDAEGTPFAVVISSVRYRY